VGLGDTISLSFPITGLIAFLFGSNLLSRKKPSGAAGIIRMWHFDAEKSIALGPMNSEKVECKWVLDTHLCPP